LRELGASADFTWIDVAPCNFGAGDVSTSVIFGYEKMLMDESPIPGLLVITPRRFGDHRGFFAETYSREKLAAQGVALEFVQDNHSLSAQAGTVRGLHFQAPPRAQAKLVRCGRGVLFDVAVDIRRGSPTYGRWFGVELSFENGKQLLIPAGFAHGFVTRAPDTEIIYKCSDYYAPETEGALAWNDPDIGIDWGLGEAAPILSAKDAAAPAFAGFDSPFVYDGGAS
jgi:dTDP-4-dehydrorhamnose 3,5-epimerase